MTAPVRSMAVLGLLLLSAAGPRGPLPLPPTPPRSGPPGRAAPIPDLFAREPVASANAGQMSVEPAWLTSPHVVRSQGFVPGSEIEGRPDRHTELAPGISLRLLLH